MKTLTLINPQDAQNLFIENVWREDRFKISVVTPDSESVWIDYNQVSPQMKASHLKMTFKKENYVLPLDIFPEESTIKLKKFQQEQASLVLSINDIDVFLFKKGDVTTEQLLEIEQSMPQLLGLILSFGIFDGYFLEDISPIQKLKNLILLKISADQLTDISPIQNLTNLTMLDLGDSYNLNDISPVQKLTNLTSLDLGNCQELTDISPIQKLTNLTTLDLHLCQNLTNIKPIQKLPNLTSLDLGNCQELTDISPIRNLTNLTTLSLHNCQELTDISPIQNLTNLKKLDLGNCNKIKNVDPILKLKNLKELELGKSSAKGIDFSDFEAFAL